MQNHVNGTFKEIGCVLKTLREERGYTCIRAFAVHFGLDPTQYWRMESGSYNYTLKSLVKILDIHKMPLDEFTKKLPHN